MRLVVTGTWRSPSGRRPACLRRRARRRGAPGLLGPARHLVQRGARLRRHRGDVVELRLGPAARSTFMRTVMPSTVTSSELARPPASARRPWRARPGCRSPARSRARSASTCGGVGQHVEHVPGPALLHGDRADPGVEGAGVEGGGDGVARAARRSRRRGWSRAGAPAAPARRRRCGDAPADRPPGCSSGRSSSSPAPPPKPDAATVMAGSGPNDVHSAASSAAPVGVVSSTPTSRP